MNDYVKIKKRLKDSGYDWMSVFEETVEEFAYKKLSEIDGDPPPYNPYLVEKNLSAMSSSLDKALALRKSANELEDKAFRQSLEYEAFKKNSENVKSLESAAWIKAQREKEIDAHNLSAEAFKTTEHGLSAGFEKTMQANIDSANSAINGEDARVDLINKKWDVLTQQQEALQLRHNHPGHALNYSERSDKIKTLLAQELVTAFMRGKAVEAGLRQVYSMDEASNSFPDLEENKANIIDKLVLWARKQIETLNLLRQEEAVYEHTISLCAPLANGEKVMEKADLDSAMDSDGKISVNLASYFPEELNSLRVLGVELSVDHKYSVDKTDMVAQENYFTRAVVVPPPQINPYSTVVGAVLLKQPLIINNATSTAPGSQLNYVRSPSIENIDPKGEWNIWIAGQFWYGDTADRKRVKAWVLDIKLHFMLASSPVVDDSQWGDFW